MAQAPKIIWDQKRLEQKPQLSKSKLYEDLIKKLDKIGEPDEDSFISEKLIFIERVTDLLDWEVSKSTKQKIIINSGIFLVLAPQKKNISDKKEIKYVDFFKKDSYGTGFLYKKYIITNFHVCRGLNTIVRDFENNVYGVKLLKFDIDQDICIYEAPKEIENQRNFASVKMEKQPKEEAYFEIKKDFEKNIFKKDEEKKLFKISNEQKDNYAKIAGVYGEDFIYKIEKDKVEDDWSKKNSFTAFGKLCLPGMSGSVIFGVNGFSGLFWGSETEEALKIRLRRKPASEYEKNPSCYFVGSEEINNLIESYEKTLLKNHN